MLHNTITSFGKEAFQTFHLTIGPTKRAEGRGQRAEMQDVIIYT